MYQRAFRNDHHNHHQNHRKNSSGSSGGGGGTIPKDNTSRDEREARHWTVALRWVGEDVKQDTKSMGYPTSHNCLDHIVRAEEGRRRAQRRKQALRNAAAGPISRHFLAFAERRRKDRVNKVKPHGLFVFLAMAAVVYPMILSLFWTVGRNIPLVDAIGKDIGEVVGLRTAWILGWVRAVVKKASKTPSGAAAAAAAGAGAGGRWTLS